MSITKADITDRMRMAMHRPSALRQPHAEEHGPHAVTKRALPAIDKPEPVKKPRRATSMNKTEREYSEILIAKYSSESQIRWEGYTLTLANRAKYTPDFAVVFQDGHIEFHEVKGAYIYPKALVKLRIAAELFPHRFFLAQKKGGKWTVTEMQKR